MDNSLSSLQTTAAPILNVSIPAEQQKNWVLLGDAKAKLAKKQEAITLELQSFINNPGTTILELEDTLNAYRKTWDLELVAEGRKFRKVIDDRVTAPSLTIEDAYNPKKNQDYLGLEKRLTALKIEAGKQSNKAFEHQREKNLFAAHIKNQYEIIVSDYKQRWMSEINAHYIHELKGRVPNPDLAPLREVVTEMKLNMTLATKYNRKYVTDDEAKEIVASIPKIAIADLRHAALQYLEDKFASYSHDLAAGTVEQVYRDAEREIAEVKNEAETSIGINNLTAQAVETPVLVPEGKKLKHSVEIVVEGTDGWMINVLTQFLKNPLARTHIIVKKIENLTVGQMCAALTKYVNETAEELPGFQYREVVK